MYSEIQCKFGRFLSYSSSSEDRLLLTFENEFVSIVIEKKDPLSYATIMFRRMEPRIIPYLKRMVHESDTCRLQNKRLSYDECLSLVKRLHDISIDITDAISLFSYVSPAPFISMQHQFDWYNLFIQTAPERILVKLRAHLMATQIKYTTWQHMANLDHFAKLVVAIDNRLELLKHEEPITYIYEPHERIRYEWIHD